MMLCSMMCMTDQTIVQTRMAPEDVEQLDVDRKVLGLQTRSDAVREGLRLLHKQARYASLSQNYDDFYGAGEEAPLNDLAAAGDQIAAEAMTVEH